MKSLILVSITALSMSAFAVSHMAGESFTPEQRKQMAEMHAKIAECLNSTSKTMQDCKQEMMKTHSMMGGKWGCPMAGAPAHPETKTKTTK